MAKYIQITVNTPLSHTDKVREALGKAGAGTIENYNFCSFSLKGIGRSKPLKGANPFIGTIGQIEVIEEEKIETFCEPSKLNNVIEALKDAHPYEEPLITIHNIEII